MHAYLLPRLLLHAHDAMIQDFMGFLHIGWDLATTEDADERSLMASSPAWETASKVQHDAAESFDMLLCRHLLWTAAAVNV